MQQHQHDRRQQVEKRVLSGLKDRMLDPEIVAEFVRAFAKEAASIRREASGAISRLRSDLVDVERRLQGVIRAIENGAWSTTLQARLADLEGRKASVSAALANAETPQTAVQLHPGSAAIYQQKVANLESALAQPDICMEAGDILAGLIDRVVLTPDATAPDGLAATLHGDLAMILALTLGKNPQAGAAGFAIGAKGKKLPGTVAPGNLLSVVAGTRNRLDLLLRG